VLPERYYVLGLEERREVQEIVYGHDGCRANSLRTKIMLAEDQLDQLVRRAFLRRRREDKVVDF
jgi:hypothetical protein